MSRNSITMTTPVTEQIRQARAVRAAIRAGDMTTSTSGLASTMQANLLVLPSRYANDFRDLCLRNPVPCPLLEVLPVKHYNSRLASHSDIDVRSDIPAYNVYEDGKLRETVTDVKKEWTDDHVGFLIGCSYSFETALKNNGLAPRSMTQNIAVPMFETNISLNPAGVFTGGFYVVSMRSYKTEDISKVREITRRFQKQHGEPIAWGWDGAARIGVKDKVQRGESDFGDSLLVPEDEEPVFWGCGVTPQVAVKNSNIEGVVLSHKPGSMFVTDLPPDDESSLTSDLLELE